MSTAAACLLSDGSASAAIISLCAVKNGALKGHDVMF